jgi:hypothetical protein
MFCPGCGSEERQTSQYCRACGTDLRVVRVSLERPDSVTASAVSAREEIGRAVADRIREVHDAQELKKVAEDVLPEIEKFLESPEEKRLRRVRAGIITASVGLGATIFMLFMSIFGKPGDQDTFMGLSSLGITAFLVGLGLVINALFFTRPKNEIEDHSVDARTQKAIDSGYSAPQLASGEAFHAQTTSNLTTGTSVTEHTTQHLKQKR